MKTLRNSTERRAYCAEWQRLRRRRLGICARKPAMTADERRMKNAARQRERYKKNRVLINNLATEKRRARGIMPRAPRMSEDERKRRARSRENARNRIRGMRERILLTPDQRAQRRRESAKKWRMLHTQKMKEVQKKYRLSHPDKIRIKNHSPEARECRNKYRKSNPIKMGIYDRKHKALRKGRLHPLVDVGAVALIIAEAHRLFSETGIRHDVDHIIPLARGGWHHHLNLQILPHEINVAKMADPLWEMPGYKSWRDVPEFLWPEKLAPIYRKKRDDGLIAA